jgi:hypothetical protein
VRQALRKFVAVTTFHQNGLVEYGQKFIDSFIKNVPIELMVYAEDCVPYVHANHTNKVHVYDLHAESPELVAFKRKYVGDPRANGQGPKSDRADAKKKFKWDAIRFSHKVYAIFAAAKRTDADVLIWIDADTFCHSHMPRNFLNNFIPEDTDIGYLGREGKYSECGFYSMNLKSPAVQEFLRKFQQMWDDAETGIFTLPEWHDSFVFDVVRHSMSLKETNWSKGIIKGEGHPLINSELGAYLDHLKGNRKQAGQSRRADLVTQRKELYWIGVR